MHYHSTQNAQFLLGHQPSCSLGLFLGPKGPGSGTKEDNGVCLKIGGAHSSC